MDFNDRLGQRPVAEAKEAWGEWLRSRGAVMAPATAARWRAVLQAALNHGAAEMGFDAPRLPAVKEERAEGTVYLTRDEQERLLGAYASHASPIATILCFAGLRVNEALRLDWRYVDWGRGLLHVAHDEREEGAPRTKTGKARSVPMHPRIREALTGIWAKEKPATGPVFLTPRKKPYHDNRGRGGNPMKNAHAGACRRAKITGFRVHDWRHHWASWMVMTGCDVPTLMRLGGWSSPRMVQRYAALSGEHMAQAIARLA